MQPLQCSRTIVLCSAAWERLRYWMDDEGIARTIAAFDELRGG
jgi:hypothetical protein